MYATENCSMYMPARMPCWNTVRAWPGPLGGNDRSQSPSKGRAEWGGSSTLLMLLLLALPFVCDLEVREERPALGSLVVCRWIRRSYSRCRRRKNSRRSTRPMTPMHEPTNMPLEVMCHVVDRKHASTVYQFQNIYNSATVEYTGSREAWAMVDAYRRFATHGATHVHTWHAHWRCRIRWGGYWVICRVRCHDRSYRRCHHVRGYDGAVCRLRKRDHGCWSASLFKRDSWGLFQMELSYTIVDSTSFWVENGGPGTPRQTGSIIFSCLLLPSMSPCVSL